MVLGMIHCPFCHSVDVVKYGTTSNGKQRFLCQNPMCERTTFILEYDYKGLLPETKQKIIDMTLNSSGIRDISRVLGISTNTVMEVLKEKNPQLQHINQSALRQLNPENIEVEVRKVEVEAEADEMWSFVGRKENQRWLWHAIDHNTGTILAYVFGTRKDEVFKELKSLLEPFGISKFYTDGAEVYERNLKPEEHEVGKENTQKIERKHLTLRTRIKRLVRKTICFSKSILMHDLVIGLFINTFDFGVVIT